LIAEAAQVERSAGLVRRLPVTEADLAGGADVLLRREWLVTNGLGGFASGSVAGAPTRRYHLKRWPWNR